MSVVKEEYQDLSPRGEKLCDVVVLAQAWKKSHTYIRRHNWYADVLELDASTIDLENHLVRWADEVCQAEFRPQDLLLVPAPKNARWWFRPTPTITSLDQLLELDLNDLGPEPTFDDWTPGEPAQAEALGGQPAREPTVGCRTACDCSRAHRGTAGTLRSPKQDADVRGAC